MAMQIGDRVRVKTSVVVYHYPEHRNEPFDIQGLEGEVKSVILDWNGRPVSANYPYLVQFDSKFRSHLHETELEVVGQPAELAAAAS